MKSKIYTKFLILIITAIVIWLLFLYFFPRITDFEARNIAIKVIKERYSTNCGGGFEKKLVLEKNKTWGDYLFSSDNGKCNIYIYVYPRGGSYESGISTN